jgi:hypothetical protein
MREGRPKSSSSSIFRRAESADLRYHYTNTKMTTFQIDFKTHKQVGRIASLREETTTTNNFSELKEICLLKCDLSTLPLHKFERATNPKTGQPYYIADIVCKMELSGSEVEIQILNHKTVLSKATIRDIEHSSSVSTWR